MKRFLLGVGAAIALLAVANANADWLRESTVHLKGLLYTGTNRVALTNTAGNLSTTTGTFSSNVAVAGTLTVTGATTHVGAVTFTAPPLLSVGAAVGATGTTGGSCTALTAEYNTVTGTALQGVCLLTAAAGKHQVVYNDSAVTLIVYPLDAGDDTLAVDDLAALSADVGVAIGPLSTLDCTAYTATKWHCLYKPGARAVVAATGTNQATCTQLGSVAMGSFVAVTAADASKSICLPTGGSSTTYIPACISIQSTVNTNTAYLPVFGSASDDDTINGAAADAVYTMGAGASVRFCTINGVDWLTR